MSLKRFVKKKNCQIHNLTKTVLNSPLRPERSVDLSR